MGMRMALAVIIETDLIATKRLEAPQVKRIEDSRRKTPLPVFLLKFMRSSN